MTAIINNFLRGHGAVFGICKAERLDDTRYGSFTPFVKSDIKARVNPRTLLPEAKSVIVIGMGHGVPEYAAPLSGHNAAPSSGYNAAQLSEHNAQQFKDAANIHTDAPEISSGVLSTLGVNDDYHKKIKSVLRELVSILREKLDFKYKILVDNATLDERALAVRAGIGFFGKNHTVISKDFGSFFNIGCVLTDIPADAFDISALIPAGSIPPRCPPDCRLCIETCPGQAITDDGNFNSLKCVSYLTQKDGELTEDEIKIIGRNLYGCDICREVCPFNKHVPRTRARYVNPAEWLAMTDEELIEKYSRTAMVWRGAGILKRNARVIFFK